MRRREFMRNAVLFTATSAGVGGSLLWLMKGARVERRRSVGTDGTDTSERALTIARHSNYSTDELLTPYRDVTSYNNFSSTIPPSTGSMHASSADPVGCSNFSA